MRRGTDSVQVLVVGRSHAALFAGVMATIRRCISPDQLHFAEDAQAIPRGSTADFIIVLQQWPEEYRPFHALTLFDRFPLARFLVCFGPWCESDGRTRSIWPLGVRASAAVAPHLITEELTSARRGRAPLPLTASRTEIFARERPLPSHPRAPLRIAVDAPVRAFKELLHDAIRAAGHTAVSETTDEVDLLVRDVDLWVASPRPREWQNDDRTKAPFVALGGFLRPQDVIDLYESGAARVLSKELPLDVLVRDFEDAVWLKELS